jgi:hypothetical protein
MGELEPTKDWKPFAYLCMGVIIGGFLGFQWAFQMTEYKMVSSLAAYKANETCSTAMENVASLYHDLQILSSQCQGNYKLPTSKNVSILPGVIDNKVVVNGP